MSRRKTGGRIMAATFGLVCLLAGTTSQARVLVNGIGVFCQAQNEFGQDEIYMKFNGVRINVGSFVSLETETTTGMAILPSLPVTAQLWEDDGDHWYDGDDLWDTVTVSSYTKTNRESEGSGGQYHIYNYWFTLSSTP